jgi:23S rRNA pseudouridine1911/1915/1917 synthase
LPWLCARLELPAAAAQLLLAEGAVFVGGNRAQKAQQPLLPGARVTVYMAAAPAATPSLRIVHVDDEVLVVDKPAGLSTQPGRRGGPSLLALLPQDARLLHRLDAEASGLLLCARTVRATAALQQALHRGEVTREYAAVVSGSPAESGRIDLRIGPRAPSGPMSTLRQCYPASSAHGQPATTLFQVISRLCGTSGTPPQALLRVRLQTGRTHQIRVHLAALGCPIVGDWAYGSQAPGQAGRAPRLFLHALRLRFRHPRTGEACQVLSPPPPEFGWPAELPTEALPAGS